MRKTIKIIVAVIGILALSGCYRMKSGSNHTVIPSPQETGYIQHDSDTITNAIDSLYASHNYGPNYNFVVKADSIVLLRQQPEEQLNGMATDSFVVKHGEHIVVADIRTIKDDHADSIWVQVARDQNTFGWIHESKLLPAVVPDDSISQFISVFSDTHLLVFLVIISAIAISYLCHRFMKRNTKVVHFNDIDSFYPTLLALIVATAATFYSSIQMFAANQWQHFYYHPSLNPFAVPTILSIFLASVWGIIIITIATIDDVFHKLPPAHAFMYLCGLGAVCAANYIIFSIMTLYYIGYALLLAYFIYAIRSYIKNNYFKYVCGNCGAKLLKKGHCPNCGAINI